MAYEIFKVDKEKTGKAKGILRDDELSRQSQVIRDCKSLGMDEEGSFFMLEGDEEVLQKALELFEKDEVGKRLEGAKKEEVRDKIKEQEENAEGGMGLLFG